VASLCGSKPMPNAKSQSAHYDAIVIGSGQAELHFSQAWHSRNTRRACRARARRRTCINEGCTPTKTMVAAAASPIWLAGPRLRNPRRHPARGHAARTQTQTRHRSPLSRRQQRRIEKTPNLDLISATRNLSLRALSPCATKRARIALSPLIVFSSTPVAARRATNRGPQRRPLSQQHVHHELNVVPEHLLVSRRRLYRARVRPTLSASR